MQSAAFLKLQGLADKEIWVLRSGLNALKADLQVARFLHVVGVRHETWRLLCQAAYAVHEKREKN